MSKYLASGRGVFSYLVSLEIFKYQLYYCILPLDFARDLTSQVMKIYLFFCESLNFTLIDNNVQ